MRYHVNPETGNANKCRAAEGNCPYRALHYSTAEEARAAYEVSQEESSLTSIRSSPLSRGAKLLLRLADNAVLLDRAVLQKKKTDRDDPEYLRLDEAATAAARARDFLQNKLVALPWDDTDGPGYDDGEEVEITTLVFEDGETRRGLDGYLFSTHGPTRDTHRMLDQASALWIKRLSTAEIKALAVYNKGALGYAQQTLGIEPHPRDRVDPEMIEYFHAALAKAPRASKPYRAYAGISHERTAGLNSEARTGLLRLKRVQSSSANPAIINSFIAPSDWHAEEQDRTVVEFQLDRVASLSAFHINRKEMELLVPPGDYEVEKTLRGLSYWWGGQLEYKESGQTADYTYLVRPARA